MNMIILYILLISYIAAINFYAFLLVKTLAAKEREAELNRQASPLIHSAQDPQDSHNPTPTPQAPPQKMIGKLCIAGALGGAITIYVCMFIFKYRRSDLLLMVLMPILGVLNVYVWVLLFRSGFAFFIVR